MSDGDGYVVGVGGGHLCRGRAIADEVVEDTGGDNGALGDSGVDYLELGSDRVVDAGSFPASEVGEQPSGDVVVERRVEELAQEGRVVHGVEGLGKVNGQGGGSRGRFGSVEARRYHGGKR